MFGEHYSQVRIHPNHQLLAKNETASFRREPLLIHAFETTSKEHHALAVKQYLVTSRRANTSSLFVNSLTLVFFPIDYKKGR